MNVSSVLMQGGVIRQRLIAEGYGESRPVASNSSDDGRARNLSEAILWHGGEAESAKEAFRTMSVVNRDALLKFLQSL